MSRRFAAAAVIVAASVALVAFKPAPPVSAEVRRIQAHFDSVLMELNASDVSRLTAEQRDHRRALILTLATYRDRARFPKNYDFDAPTPYFVDRQTGVLCAVAHLMEFTGRRDIVDRVAAANNNVWVPQLRGDREFEAWLGQQGITLAEAARIQVPYMGDRIVAPEAPSRQSVVLPATGAGLAATVSAMNLFSNRDGHGRIRNVVGMATGVASLGYGAAMLARPETDRGMAIANVATGALSAFVAGRGILRNRQMVAAQRGAERARVAVAPVVPVEGSGTGVSLNVRF
jgi:hypothetical protein